MVLPTAGFSRSGLAALTEQWRLRVAAERTARAAPFERFSAQLTATRDAITALTPRVDALRTAAANLGSATGGGVRFAATSSNDTIVSATSGTGAATGSATLTVTSLARGSAYSFIGATGPFSDPSAAIAPNLPDDVENEKRSVVFSLGAPGNVEEVTVELRSSTTLEDFVTLFNEASTRATASIVATGTAEAPAFAVSITSNETGTAASLLGVTLGSQLLDADNDGKPTDPVFGSAVLTQATDATFTIEGVAGTFSRSRNSVTDVLAGVTLELRSTGTATVTVAPDTTATVTAVRSFVAAHNDLVDGVAAGTRASSGESFGSAPLRRTRVDDDLVQAARSGLAGGVAGGLAQFGVTTERDGRLVIDDAALTSAITDSTSALDATVIGVGQALGGTGGALESFRGSTGLLARATSEQTARLQANEERLSNIERLFTARAANIASGAARLDDLLSRLEGQRSLLAGLFGGR